MPRAWAASASASQNPARSTAATAPQATNAASALAPHTRSRRGSNSSWLLIDPLAQSAPANVVPTMIISAATSTTTATPVPRCCSPRSRADRFR